MHIQEGKYYIARNGELVGPMEDRSYRGDDAKWWADQYGLYRDDGKFGYGDDIFYQPYDITYTVEHAAMKAVEGN